MHPLFSVLTLLVRMRRIRYPGTFRVESAGNGYKSVIGIMNIMLVSVTERTREIGIRLAIGALEKEVLMQFLTEAVALSAFGGLIGILLAAIACYGLASLQALPFLFDPAINLLAFGFSAAIGVIFGYVPARRAARLDPIGALRHE